MTNRAPPERPPDVPRAYVNRPPHRTVLVVAYDADFPEEGDHLMRGLADAHVRQPLPHDLSPQKIHSPCALWPAYCGAPWGSRTSR